MATVNGYGAKFIGNDFVAPGVENKVVRPAAVSQPHYLSKPVFKPMAESESNYANNDAETAFSTQLATVKQSRRVPHLLTLRSALIAAVAIALIATSIFAVPRLSGAWHAVHTVGSRIALGASEEMDHKTQSSFVMPAYAVLVKNSVLSTYADAVESQAITISVGSTTVTPEPSDIAKWTTTSAGPESGTTLIKVDTGAISAYLSQVMQKYGASSGSSDTAVSNATNQLTRVLLKYNGASISLSGN